MININIFLGIIYILFFVIIPFIIEEKFSLSKYRNIIFPFIIIIINFFIIIQLWFMLDYVIYDNTCYDICYRIYYNVYDIYDIYKIIFTFVLLFLWILSEFLILFFFKKWKKYIKISFLWVFILIIISIITNHYWL